MSKKAYEPLEAVMKHVFTATDYATLTAKQKDIYSNVVLEQLGIRVNELPPPVIYLPTYSLLEFEDALNFFRDRLIAKLVALGVDSSVAKSMAEATVSWICSTDTEIILARTLPGGYIEIVIIVIIDD